MKKMFILFCALNMALSTYAQTGPQLLGIIPFYGANGAGTITGYTAGNTALSQVFSFPAVPLGGDQTTINPTEAPNGKFYGANGIGGPVGVGHAFLFEYDYTTNTYTDAMDFNSAYSYPSGALLLASDGLLYGISNIIFSYQPGSNVVNILTPVPTNLNPTGGLMQASNGNLYGLTWGDGSNGGGTIYQFDMSTNSFSVLFNLPVSAFPEAGALIEVGADTLYGLTSGDGSDLSGTLFRYIIGTNSYTVLKNLLRGASPDNNLMRASNGLIYGMTAGDGLNAGGTIFTYNIVSASYTDIFDFGGAGSTEGTRPYDGLLQASDGLLYGMTNSGGLNNKGVLFRFDPTTSTYTKEVDLDSATGSNPYSGHLVEYAAPSGISTVNNYTISLYPNPTSGLFTITNNYSGTLTVNIINLLGERLKTFTMSGSQQSFDIIDLAAGIYEVHISDGNQTLKVMKVVKE